MTSDITPQGRLRIRGIALLSAVAVTVAVLLVGALALSQLTGATGDPRSALPTTVPVTDAVSVDILQRTILVPAQLAPVRSFSVLGPDDGPAVISALPIATGRLAAAGIVIIEVTGQPVFLLQGSFPAWRRFEPGMTSGRDVAQLEQALAAIGLFNATSDDRFDDATAAAVAELYSSNGYSPDHSLSVFQVVFVGGGEGWFEAPSVRVGDELAEGAATVASLERRIRVNLSPSALEVLRPDQSVLLSATSGETVVSSLITSVTVEAGSDTGELRTVFVELADQPPEGDWGALTAQIEIESTEAPVPTASPAAVFLDPDDGRSYVVVAVNGDQQRVDVDVGMVGDRRVELITNDRRIQDGANLVLNPSDA